MASRDLRVEIDADAAKFEAGIERARKATMRMEDQLRSADLAAAKLDKQLEGEAAKAAQKRADAMEKLGRGLVTFGAATLVGLGMAAKAAIDWETSWAGVRKTVEGSPEELAQLETELRGLATTLPATHKEIAGVAEAAGQLGIATKDVSAFTKVMIDLGETTNLTAEEAATSIAQLMNIMQTAPGDVDNLASALVDLGNNGASTEKDILELSLRLAAAGAQIGLSEAEVLGFANAMASLGIEAEAGGSALSKVMADMSKAVSQGGDKLEGFAQIAGVSAEEFARAFREDPAAAINTFTEGLARIQASGGDVFTALDDLGLGTIRVRDALLRLAGGGDLLSDSLDRGARAWEDNSALAEEAAKRYETTEAKIAIAKNTLVDLAIDVGGVLLPALSALAEKGADVLRWFSDLPGPVKTVATVLGGVLGAVSLLSGGLLLLAPRLVAAKTVLATLGGPGLASGVGRVTGALSKLTVGLGAAVIGWQILMSTAKDFEVGTGAAAEALQALGRGVSTDLIDRLVSLQGELEGADKLLGIIPTSIDGWTTSAKDSKEVNDEWAASVEAIDQVLSTMVSSGDLAGAAEATRLLGQELGLSGDEMEAFAAEHLPLYADALKGAKTDQADAAAGAEELGGALGVAAGGADDAVAALEEYLDAVQRATDPVFALNDALSSVEESQTAYNDAVEEFGKESPEAEQAAIDLMGSLSDLETAALNGELSFGDFSTKLDEWVAAGDITKEQADAIRGRVKELRGEAEDYKGRYDATIAEQGAKQAEAKVRSAAGQAKKFERRYEAKIGADKRGADLAIAAAQRRASTWGRTKKNANIGIFDRASGPVRHIRDLIAGLRSKTVYIKTVHQTVFSGGARSPQPRATGGSMTPDETFLVGEQGPELFRPTTQGHLFNTTQSAAMISSAPVSSSSVGSMSSGPARDVRITFDFLNADSDLARALRKMVRTGQL